MKRLQLFVIILAMIIPGVVAAQTRRLRGKIVDSSGLVMPGAQVKLFQGDALTTQTTSSSTGDFEMLVPAGNYRLEVSAADFQLFRRNVSVTPNMGPLT